MAATRLIIVGGVAGGATAAARARRLSEDAEIIVLERGPHMSFANCGLPYHIGGEIAQRDKLLLQTPAAFKARYNVEVRVRNEVLAIDRAKKEVRVRDLETGREYAERYDKLILSPGAVPIRPALPGIDHPKIFALRDLPDMDRIKAAADGGAKSALVVGGGFIGLEVAEAFRARAMCVHLVEMLDQVMPPLDREMVTPIHQTLRAHGVELHLSDAVESFADAGGQVAATLRSGVTLTADVVVMSVGIRPETKLAAGAGLDVNARGAVKVNEQMQTSDPDIFAVGDAVAVTDAVMGAETLIPLAGPANRQGRIAADNALGRHSRYRGTQGTSIVRVFDVVAASTGAAEKTLKRAGADYEKVFVHPAQHAGYFPGAAQMSLKLLFSTKDGRVLGAQIVGKDGVDKRIDVIATAIQAKMTVYDLEEAELAYAPPFGSAKDPVNMAGFVAANVLRGDTKVVHADSLDGWTVVDVREPAEHQAGATPGSILMPLGQLRARHGELPKGKPIAVSCQVGLRGYIAERLLRQLGYDVHNVSGGYRSYCMYNPKDSAGGCTPQANAPANDSGESKPVPAVPAGGGSCCSGSGEPVKPDRDLDVRGKQCPGPIMEVGQAMAAMTAGQVLRVRATDVGFAADIRPWCESTGNELIRVGPESGHYVAMLRRGSGAVTSAACPSTRPAATTGKTLVVFSGDLDRVLAAFVIANGAAAMGNAVTLFFTFWGLNALRRENPPSVSKGLLDRMFGWMMPRGAARLKLSKMNMGGMGTAMMKHVMKSKNVLSLPEMIAQAKAAGVRMVACSMSMDVMGLKREELIDGLEVGGVGMFLGAANASNATLFI